MFKSEKALVLFVVVATIVSITLMVCSQTIGQYLRDVKLGNRLRICEPLMLNRVVIGQRCIPRFFHNGVDERYEILPEYQLAFFEMKSAEFKNYPGRQWLFQGINPVQRIPGTDRTYDFIPPYLDPQFQERSKTPEKRAQ